MISGLELVNAGCCDLLGNSNDSISSMLLPQRCCAYSAFLLWLLEIAADSGIIILILAIAVMILLWFWLFQPFHSGSSCCVVLLAYFPHLSGSALLILVSYSGQCCRSLANVAIIASRLMDVGHFGARWLASSYFLSLRWLACMACIVVAFQPNYCFLPA